MRLWRISKWKGLAGIGGTLASARWHTMPRPVLYLSEHPALAMLEVLAHMHLTAATVPVSLRLLEITVARGARKEKAPILPAGWQANQPATQIIGNAWLDAGKTLLMPVPSALVPHAQNWLVNPTHAQHASHLTEHDHGVVWIDPRFIR